MTVSAKGGARRLYEPDKTPKPPKPPRPDKRAPDDDQDIPDRRPKGPKVGNQGSSGRGANAAAIAARGKAGLAARKIAQINATSVRKSEIKTRPVAKSEVTMREKQPGGKRLSRARYV